MSAAGRAAARTGAVAESIRTKLHAALKPTLLQVLNESDGHNVPRGSETHFKVVVVSNSFEGEGLLARHRLVNSVLEEELAGPIHALSIVAKTPAQWDQAEGAVEPSPPCMGGSKR